MGIQNSAGDNVAHFAHIGGMIFGYLIIKYWKKNDLNFY
jgi:membrane associated rhomboid family serine protease